MLIIRITPRMLPVRLLGRRQRIKEGVREVLGLIRVNHILEGDGVKSFPFGRLWLSPMESVSDLGFRTLCYQHGASLTFTEMVRASALVQGNKATLSLVDTYTSSVKTGL